jgi:hypothetical protein
LVRLAGVDIFVDEVAMQTKVTRLEVRSRWSVYLSMRVVR